MEENFEDFKKEYDKSNTFNKTSQYIKQGLVMIYLLQTFYSIILIFNFYTLFLDSTQYGIKLNYLIGSSVLKIFFVLMLIYHSRNIQNNDYQLECIYQNHYQENMVNYSYDQLDTQFNDSIKLLDFLLNTPVCIILATINYFDFTCVTYLIVQGQHSGVDLFDYIVTLLPCYSFLLLMAIFTIMITFILVLTLATTLLSVFCWLPCVICTIYRGGVPPSDENIIIRDYLHMREAPIEGICSICLQEYENGDDVCNLTCSLEHHFHIQCIQDWIKTNPSCPICRSHL